MEAVLVTAGVVCAVAAPVAYWLRLRERQEKTRAAAASASPPPPAWFLKYTQPGQAEPWRGDAAAVRAVVLAVDSLAVSDERPPASCRTPVDEGCVICLGVAEPEDAHEVPNLLAAAAREAELRTQNLQARGWATLHCQHVMHAACLRGWFSEQALRGDIPSCPVCRSSVCQHADNASVPSTPVSDGPSL